MRLTSVTSTEQSIQKLTEEEKVKSKWKEQVLKESERIEIQIVKANVEEIREDKGSLLSKLLAF